MLQMAQGSSWGTSGSSEAEPGQLEDALSPCWLSLSTGSVAGSLFILQLAPEGDSWGYFCMGGPEFISQNFPSLEHGVL